MSRVCEITGKKPMSGHNVSHSNTRTKRRFMPNLQHKSMMSELLGHMVRLRLSTNAMRTIDKHGGLDGFMLQVKNRRVMEFSDNAKRLCKLINKKSVVNTTPANTAE